MLKLSSYNTILNLSDNINALYCATSDKYVVFKKQLINDLKLGIEELKIKNRDLFDELLNAGAIIDRTNEFLELKNKSYEIDSNQSSTQLFINPTLDCNFNCWYCYENHIKKSKISPEILERIKKLVKNLILKNDKLIHFYLSFFGGEPLLGFRNVKQIILNVADQCKYKNIPFNVNFTSNGYLINSEKIRFLKDTCNGINFQITLDGDRESHNKTRYLKSGEGSYNRIINNIRNLLKNEISVIIRINYTKENFHTIPNILRDLKNFDKNMKKFIKIDLQKVWQDSNQNFEIDRILELFLNENIVASTHKNTMDQLRYSCYADKKNEMLINYNGDVFKCTARDFLTENRDGYLKEDGTICWTRLTPSERLDSKMNRAVCKKCKILPLCGGGCSQKCIEIEKTKHCIYGYTEEDKKKIVLDRFYNNFVIPYEKNSSI